MVDHPVLAQLVEAIPAAMWDQSGKVFYSGRRAFSEPARLYVVGHNPGGDPEGPSETTVRDNAVYELRQAPDLWSAYTDEAWAGHRPGTFGIQQPMLRLFAELGIDPRTIPASNMVFVRSRRAKDLSEDRHVLEDMCWPFHATVISRLKVRIVLALGSDAGASLRHRLAATELIGTFVERNHRRWTSSAHRSRQGPIAVTLTHPSRARWSSAATNPAPLVAELLG